MEEQQRSHTLDAPWPDAAPKQRIEFVDIAKGIAILAIVVGHMWFTVGDMKFLVSDIVFQFHVPLFFVCSGYFLSSKRSLGRFCADKFTRLAKPYVFTCAFILVASFILVRGFHIPALMPRFDGFTSFVLAAIYGAGTVESPTPFGIPAIGALWFLQALLIALVVTRIAIDRLGTKAWIPLLVLALLAIGSSYRIWLPFNIQSGLLASLYIYFGWLLRKRGIQRWIGSLPLFLVFLTIFLLDIYAQCNVNIAGCQLRANGLGFPTSLCVCMMVLQISAFIDRHSHYVKRFLLFFGVNSLVVLCVHSCFLDMNFEWFLVDWGLSVQDNSVQFVNLAVQLSVCALSVPAIKYTPLLRKVFY